MPPQLPDQTIHLMLNLVICGIETACGRVMMSGGSEWSSWFTQWGKTPLVMNKGFVNGTFDVVNVTCPACLRAIQTGWKPSPFNVTQATEFRITKPRIKDEHD